ncbi:MAG: transposase [bacterium]
MPAKNRVKIYVDDSYYHIYNRGVAKCPIFEDHDDYVTFLADLKFYLSPIPKHFKGPTLKVTKGEKTYVYFPSQQPKNHTGKIDLVAYCLMPNHFHLCIRQTDKMSMTNFMRSLSTKYSMYFNKKYARVGSLFQGVYKAVLISQEQQFLYLTKYIHRNPLEFAKNLSEYPYSSYRNYLGIIHQNWIHSENVLTYFSKTNLHNSYQNFVEESPSELEDTPALTLE